MNIIVKLYFNLIYVKLCWSLGAGGWLVGARPYVSSNKELTKDTWKKKKSRVLMKYCFPYLLISKLDFLRITPGKSVGSIITHSWNISFYFCMMTNDRAVHWLVRKYKISYIPQPPVLNWVPKPSRETFSNTPWNCVHHHGCAIYFACNYLV